ncbi:MAG: hypothetical protein EZS26_000737 [Candidatus Ordinivivax streblomastigis]|uniref:Uncharacterized protein n=1 Tax=Candidatus Ordinivivax streblomastigis TaxID=2540710 RepID=A0A5M8P426_9BACT|nr:MAG: hypothetical protein EZS26_000737 [Candidatus Ordinivivax streblomastigis]
MAVADLNNEKQEVITANDNIVIVDNFQSIRGGRTLDVTGFTPEVINAGHVIIKETATGNYKPMPVATEETTEYAELPDEHTYAGILINSILTKKPFAGILVRGTVNPAAAPYAMTNILAAVKTALPLIDFRED